MRKTNGVINKMTDKTRTTRRQYVKTLTTGAIGATTVARTNGVVAQTNETVVFEQDFESIPTGEYPSNWTKDGNDDQQVVEADAASGSKCLEQKGSFGGCWHALANAPVEFPASYSVRITGAVKPLDKGSYGCHDTFRCYLSIRTDVGSWSTGNGYRLLNFEPDGTVQGRTGDNTVLGSYTIGEWNRFAIGYRPTDSGVEFTFRINGEESGPFVVDAAGFESQLSYLKFASGDFLTQWDDLRASRLPAKVSPLESQAGTNGQSDAGDGGIPVLSRFGEDGESLGLGLGVLGVVGGGSYLMYRRSNDDAEDQRSDQRYR